MQVEIKMFYRTFLYLWQKDLLDLQTLIHCLATYMYIFTSRFQNSKIVL